MTTLRTVAILAAAILASGTAFAQSASTEKPEGEPKAASAAPAAMPAAVVESPLVKAAKDGAAKRTKKSRLSIDDKDVTKSRGKLIETTTKPLPPVPSAAEEAGKRLLSEEAKAKVEARGRSEAAERFAAAQKEVESLESELRRIEETYYDEDDPDFREEVIEKRFEDTKSRLDKARQDLEDARNAASGSGASTP